ncbi:MAG TPA: hypothetical protein VGH53_31840 [Streptosporangiaceae bacterium]|jgi:hypothetical protein
MNMYGSAAAAKLAASHLALGGVGIGGLIIHLFIWHMIFRLMLFVWHIHTFGPFIFFAIIAAFIGYGVWRRQIGPRRRARRGGLSGYGTGSGPRDW